ncbi:MAG: YjbQ family protein [Anaerolineales bacterium]|nr:YjbQ family protein [Anaerolineales bacterium]
MAEPLKNTFFVSSRAAQQLIDITGQVQATVDRSGIKNGVCFLFLPHTTAALTLNENWDPAVPADILHTLEHQTAPSSAAHRHQEGNSPAHVRSSLLGASQFLLIEDGRLLLGSWQGVFLAEFDGPRERRVIVKVMEG